MSTQNEDVALDNARWKYRRFIAMFSLRMAVGILIVLFVLAIVDVIFGTDILSKVGTFESITTTVIISLFSLVGAYMGLATIYSSPVATTIQSEGNSESEDTNKTSLVSRVIRK